MGVQCFNDMVAFYCRFYLLIIRVLSQDATSTHARQIGNFYFRFLGRCKPTTVLLGLITRFSLWKTSKAYDHNGAVIMTHNVTLASLIMYIILRNFYRYCNSIGYHRIDPEPSSEGEDVGSLAPPDPECTAKHMY